MTQIQIRRGTSVEWTSANPVLAEGELGFETNTLKLKIGNGSTAWTSLGYQSVDWAQVSGKPAVIAAGATAADARTAISAASLDVNGKVPVSELPNSIMAYQGTWDVSGNAPTLADGTGNPGDVYRVTVGGSRNLGSGSISFSVGDYVIYNPAGVWEKADTTDAVSSIAGKTGNVTLVKADVGLGNVDNTSNATERAATATLTNKTISGASNTLSAIPQSAITNLATNLLTDRISPATNQQLVLNAGESSGVATGQTNEIVYINAENGMQVNSSPDNWVGGWAARKTATICDTSGNSSFPGTVTGTQLVSNIATGTAPLAVTSTTAVTNLNADLLDGLHTATANTVNTVVARDANGDINVRYGNSSYVSMSHTAAARTTDTVFYSSTDNYIRKNTAAGFKTSLGLNNVSNVAASATATASSIAQRDANKNLTADNFLSTSTSTATAAGTTTMDIASTQIQIFTGTTTQTVKLPTTSILAGQSYTIVNNSTGAVTVQSSAANTITVQAAGRVGVYTAMIATPTTDAHWVGTTLAAGKVFKATNDLTLSGTDGTTFTFPSTSGTVVTQGSALGTPASGTLTNATGLPVAGISATGTRDSTTYLRGDGTWAASSGGISTGKAIAMAIVFG